MFLFHNVLSKEIPYSKEIRYSNEIRYSDDYLIAKILVDRHSRASQPVSREGIVRSWDRKMGVLETRFEE